MDVIADLGRLGKHQTNSEIPPRKTEIGVQIPMAEKPNGISSAFRYELGRMCEDPKIDQCRRHLPWEAPGQILEQNPSRHSTVIGGGGIRRCGSNHSGGIGFLVHDEGPGSDVAGERIHIRRCLGRPGNHTKTRRGEHPPPRHQTPMGSG